MTCAEVQGLFGDVADARLASDELAAWHAHLAACPECSREWASFERTLHLLHGLPPERAPAGFVDRVMAAAYPESWFRRLAQRLFVPLRLKLPLEAAALMLVAVSAVYLAQRTPPIQRAIRDGAPPISAPGFPSPEPSTGLSRPVASEPDPPTALAHDPEASQYAARTEGLKATKRTGPETQAPTPQQSQRTGEAAQSARREALLARTADAAPAVVGRLVVEDRAAAERALGELTARVGATEVGRVVAKDGLLVELDVPPARYAEFARGLAHLGRWMPAAEGVGSDAAVRVRITVARRPDP